MAERIHGTAPKPLEMYAGRYYNKSKTFFLDIRISEDDNGLDMACQGYRNATFHLSHYHYDVFWWPCDRDADCKEALFPQYYVGFHRIYFHTNDSGEAISCNWQIDKAIPEGENFYKRVRE